MSSNEQYSKEIDMMIEEIKDKLHIVNGAALKAEHFSPDKIDDIREIHAMVVKKNRFSVSELDAIVSELGTMRR